MTVVAATVAATVAVKVAVTVAATATVVVETTAMTVVETTKVRVKVRYRDDNYIKFSKPKEKKTDTVLILSDSNDNEEYDQT